MLSFKRDEDRGTIEVYWDDKYIGDMSVDDAWRVISELELTIP